MQKGLIGKVRFTELLDTTQETYSDGDIEDKLLHLFKNPKPDVDAFLKKYPAWATTYHLSPVRQNLLNWYDFAPSSSALEVGAGCGAITELLVQKCDSVVAIELTKRRALVNAYRNKRHANLEVVVGNLENLNTYSKERFDYVVCVGVLEYAGRFIGGDAPFEAFLNTLRAYLNPGGTLLLAIENGLGLKYFSGSREDHVQRYMENIEGYPHYDGIKTFGKTELQGLLTGSGFNTTRFYYPCPDYKMPHTIYSDDYLPGVHTPNIPSSFYPTPNPDQPRQQFFREQLAVRTVSRNGLFGELANSFLVAASPRENAPDFQAIYAHSSIGRKKAYRTLTRINNVVQLAVEKSPLEPPAAQHILSLRPKHNNLAKALAGNPLQLNKITRVNKDRGAVTLEYVHGQSLETIILNALIGGDEQRVINILRDFRNNVIGAFPAYDCVPTKQRGFASVFGQAYTSKIECVKPGIVDLNLDNIIYNAEANKYTVIDYEWSFSFALPKSFVFVRAMLYLFQRHSQVMRGVSSPECPAIELSNEVLMPLHIYEAFKEDLQDLVSVLDAEVVFQEFVAGVSTPQTMYKQPMIHREEYSDTLVHAYETAVHELDNYRSAKGSVAQKQQEIERLQSELRTIAESKSWKLLTKANKARSQLRKIRPLDNTGKSN